MPLFSFFLSRKRSFVFIGILLGLTFLAFSPVLKAQFLNWSDDKYLTSNANILTFDWVHMKVLLRERIGGLHIPLSSLTFSLEHHLFGLNPFVFHLDNLLLHFCSVVLVFYLAMSLGLNLEEAFLGALIFAIHPTKVEAVAWISGRKELLYTVFYLASLMSYLRNYFWLSFILSSLSILANPMGISLPLVMILMDWFNGKRISITAFLSKGWYFLMAAFIGGATYLVFLQKPLFHPFQAPLIWMWSSIFYIVKFFIPTVFAPLYVLPKPINLFVWNYLGSIIIFICIFAALWLFRKQRWIVFAFVFYLLSIFFVLPLEAVKENNILSDRFLYLPSLGFCLLSAVGIFKLRRFLMTQEAVLLQLFNLAVGILIMGLILLTFNQSQVWRDSLSLWGHQVKVLPHPYALNKLAHTIIDGHQPSEKEYMQAVDVYQKAILLDPKYVRTYSNMAELYKEKGNLNEAFMWYTRALEIDNKDKDSLLGMGLFFLDVNKPQQAIEIFKRLLKLYPDDENVYMSIIDAYSKAVDRYPNEKAYQEQREEVLSEYEDLSKRKKYTAADYYNLGFLYEQVGGYEEAIRFYKKSLLLNPANQKSLYNLANRYQEMGDLKSALVLYQSLVHYHPKFAPAYLNMGIIYNTLGNVSQARMLYLKTINIDPKNAGAYFYLGYICEVQGDFKDALNYYEKAVDINPQLAEGYYNMGNVYAALGLNPEAIASYLKTININKSHQNAFVNLSILSFKSRDFPGAIKYLQEAQRLGYSPPEEYLKSLEPYRRK